MKQLPSITGTQINYYFVCKRELWFFSRDIQCEQESDVVTLGRLLHETSYSDKKKEFQFDRIKVDWIDLEKKVLHEVKKSNKAEDAHIWQIKYYLLYLKELGLNGFTGELNYPKLKKKTTVILEKGDEEYLKKVIYEIQIIESGETPPPIEVGKKICKSCSYFELCYS